MAKSTFCAKSPIAVDWLDRRKDPQTPRVVARTGGSQELAAI
ncbi:hypothetical protein [Methylopila sp. M107]|nr:hypothetical protein [Methylopila sp. M107]